MAKRSSRIVHAAITAAALSLSLGSTAFAADEVSPEPTVTAEPSSKPSTALTPDPTPDPGEGTRKPGPSEIPVTPEVDSSGLDTLFKQGATKVDVYEGLPVFAYNPHALSGFTIAAGPQPGWGAITKNGVVYGYMLTPPMPPPPEVKKQQPVTPVTPKPNPSISAKPLTPRTLPPTKEAEPQPTPTPQRTKEAGAVLPVGPSSEPTPSDPPRAVRAKGVSTYHSTGFIGSKQVAPFDADTGRAAPSTPSIVHELAQRTVALVTTFAGACAATALAIGVGAVVYGSRDRRHSKI
ncbi:hypothetical protein [Streptomyces narbonensis]|uniref:hypothetical protein n=1 Tax=Streptomyces narbonensis TaxID=67333 RepID=UPI0033D5C140